MQDLGEALGDITNLKALKSGTLRMAAPQLMGDILITEALAALSKQHPEIDIHWSDSVVDGVLHTVQEARCISTSGLSTRQIHALQRNCINTQWSHWKANTPKLDATICNWHQTN